MCVVLLGPLPSLHHLRRRLPLCVRQLHWYYTAVRLLQRVRARCSALRLCGPVYLIDRRAAGLPVLVHVVSRRAQGLRPRRVLFWLAILSPYRCCFPTKQTGSARGSSVFGAQCPGPPMPLSTLRRTPRDALRKIKVRIESLLLFCRALSSPTTCRFIQAHSHPCVALPSAPVPNSVNQNINLAAKMSTPAENVCGIKRPKV